MGFSRQAYWSGLPCPPTGDLPDTGIEPGSPSLQADSLPLTHQGSPDFEYLDTKIMISSAQSLIITILEMLNLMNTHIYNSL